ncbi:D-alanyl-D-alanine carboxypeptidase/D-alanyl-D-alanine-endopeptidase [Uliginosibacterium sp. 31-16]|uniref:D-alanyl-D-alanine carboxypeptidase/D-alanyl-D-alanine endopeptidase n=1 Tax=Uliginosibacterium sp. 31-16 TaxID=3068315 RepID=UPI00273F36B5|nr:D-alanyl-D-alanine carboxypeptidase/D-alanyl-D-alanine-endopeptidase [Uliginosibacterium sp. 31-16]MDP5238224.1 D-alanyl-D-alanine carboxypeptidase/D-alanyl-D-alanine-endopeptidase [Uliginosibacterium sp. 31-16]
MSSPLLRLILASFASLTLCAHAALPDPVARAVREAGLPPESVGLWIAPAAGGEPTLLHNANTLMNPASVMKLITSYAALDQLGPAYTWKTGAVLRGPLQDGVLDGDLAIIGSGDPSLTWDRLGQWLRDWRSRGLRQIRGNIVIDASLIPAAPVSAPFDEAQHRAYNAQPDAFLVNFGALSLRLTPTFINGPVGAEVLTPAAPLRIVNRLRSSNGACTDWRSALRGSFVPESNGKDKGMVLTLDGRLSVSCGERQLNLKVDDSLRWASLVIRAQWQELGGSWSGDAVRGSVPVGLVPFSTWESQTLPEVLRDMNKWSNNVMARQIFLALGADGGAQGSDKSLARLQAWMPAQGLDATQWIVENGSGLSRNERSTAAQLGTLLRSAWRSPRMPEFVMGLPVIGKDGTMRSRLIDTPLAGRGYVKTGTLDGVKSAAGYVLDAQGNWQAFALILNHPKAPGAEAVVEAVLRGIYGMQ